MQHAATSMAAMFVAVAGVRAHERRSTARRAGAYTPATPVVASPQETYQETCRKTLFFFVARVQLFWGRVPVLT